MGADFFIVLRWWGTLFLVGAVAYPLTKRLFVEWYDQGYFFAKAVGMATITYLVYLLGMFHVAPFVRSTLFLVMGVVFVLGLILSKSPTSPRSLKWKTIITEEFFFFVLLLFWSWVKGHEPSIRGLEKFMDYGFMQSILNSAYFPAPDMWFAGYPINYYYFGHTVVAVLTKLSGIDLAYTFNLMLATIFALCATMSFSIGRQLIRGIGGIGGIGEIGGGLLTAFLVTLAGNMQTLYAFTKGYTGEDVQPFWTLAWRLGDIGGIGGIWNGTLMTKLTEGLERYWYANATRFIPFTIHEFPSYSFVVSDVHGHVMSIPFALLAIAFLIVMSNGLWGMSEKKHSASLITHTPYLHLAFYGFLCAVLLMTNALDGPIYFGLFIIVLGGWGGWGDSWKKVKIAAVVIVSAGLASLPFLLHFKSFVSGVAVNCPPALLAERKIGIVLFETIDKCQQSPLWMMYLLWGFFWFCGAMLIASRVREFRGSRGIRWIRDIREIWGSRFTQNERLLVVFFIFSILLLIFPEFFYFKDIYPAHFRSNTMFKLGYQAFIMFSIVAGYVIVLFVSSGKQDHSEKSQIPNPKSKTNPKFKIINSRKMFFLLLAPQLFLVSIYPIFSVRSYFDSLRSYKTLDGTAWLREQYPDDWAGIEWMNNNAKCQALNAKCKNPVIIEADGDSYTDYERFSTFTGFPTIVGWAVHEWLWRGGYDVVSPRREDVRVIYESEDLDLVRSTLDKYQVSYVIVGAQEREKYPTISEEKFNEIGERVFVRGSMSIYRVDN